MSTPPKGVGVLASGGVESAVLLHRMADEGEPVRPLYVRQGFRWERVEVFWLERFLIAAPRPEFLPLEVLVLPLADIYPHDHFGRGGAVPVAGTPDEECYLPGRNVTLLSKAAVFAALENYRAIAIGSLGGNPFPDATSSFFASMSAAVSEGCGQPIEILAPLLAFQKREILHLGKDLPLDLTFSCMEPAGEIHCGRCSKCHERRQAFAAARMADPTPYAG